MRCVHRLPQPATDHDDVQCAQHIRGVNAIVIWVVVVAVLDDHKEPEQSVYRALGVHRGRRCDQSRTAGISVTRAG